MSRINRFVIERENQHRKEYLAAARQVWVQEWAKAFLFSNIEDARRYQADYTSSELGSQIMKYLWPQVRLSS